MNFPNVIGHLEVMERMHRSNATMLGTPPEEAARFNAVAEEYRAARELLQRGEK